MIVNELGGKQSKINGRFDLVPSGALAAAAEVLSEGAEKYGEYNWELISTEDHVNHALAHLNVFLSQRRDASRESLGHFDVSLVRGEEDDLAHAIVRLMFAWEIREMHRRFAIERSQYYGDEF